MEGRTLRRTNCLAFRNGSTGATLLFLGVYSWTEVEYHGYLQAQRIWTEREDICEMVVHTRSEYGGYAWKEEEGGLVDADIKVLDVHSWSELMAR